MCLFTLIDCMFEPNKSNSGKLKLIIYFLRVDCWRSKTQGQQDFYFVGAVGVVANWRLLFVLVRSVLII